MKKPFISVEWRNLKKYERELETFAKKAVPYAIKQTVNDAAFALQTEWRGEIKRTLVTRNQYTVGAVRVEQARGLNVRTMEARTGSIAHYAERTEQGGTVRGGGRHGKAVPTAVASGQAMGANPITRLPTRRNKTFAIVRPGGKAKSVKARNAAAIRRAAAQGGGVVRLIKGNKQGLFRVGGGKRRIKVKMLWDLSRKSVKTAPHPTLAPALKRVQKQMPSIMKKNLLFQLKRHRVLGY